MQKVLVIGCPGKRTFARQLSAARVCAMFLRRAHAEAVVSLAKASLSSQHQRF